MSPWATPTLSASHPRVSPSGMKQMSWLSGFCATVSPRAAASARTIAFDGVRPSGKYVCASCSAVSTPSTYDWSFASSLARCSSRPSGPSTSVA